MLETFQISLICTLLGLTWYLLIKSGGLLQCVSQWANTRYDNTLFSKLIQCPYCVAGQLSLFTSIVVMFLTGELIVLLSAPITINTTFLVFVYLYKGVD